MDRESQCHVVSTSTNSVELTPTVYNNLVAKENSNAGKAPMFILEKIHVLNFQVMSWFWFPN
jgi:hypothetical protein